MKREYWYCDLCGKEVSNEMYLCNSTNTERYMMNSGMAKAKYNAICYECADKIMAFVEHIAANRETH